MPETRYYETYQNGVLISRTPYTVSDVQIERDQAPARLQAALSRMTTIASQAQAAADSTTALTLVQLTAQHRQLAGAVADMARALRALLIREFEE